MELDQSKWVKKTAKISTYINKTFREQIRIGNGTYIAQLLYNTAIMCSK